MTISIHAEKAFNRTQNPFMINPHQTIIIEAHFLNKGHLYKHTTNNVLISKRLSVFLLRLGTWYECSLLPLPFNTILKVLDSAMFKKKRYEECSLESKK